MKGVRFQEERLAAVKVGESSSPLEPLNVSEETNEFDYSDISNNYDLIAYPNSTQDQNWQQRPFM